MKYNLLSDPLIRVLVSGRARKVSLPGLFAAMARHEVDGFPALRAHQNAAWHMFLVQLAALALWTAGRDRVISEEPAWRDMLRGLTADHLPGDEPWHLVVEDGSCPAFLQSPCPAKDALNWRPISTADEFRGDRGSFRPPAGLKWKPISTADELDLLVTSRNFDIKQAIACSGQPEDWLYALVSLQTMQGYSGGRGLLRGIARMNGGYANRPLIGLAPGSARDMTVHPSAWWIRDVGRLASSDRDPVVAKTPGKPGGPALLWCLEWREGEQLKVADLDPWFIEVCRRIRLGEAGGRLTAKKSTSKKARIDAQAFHGNLGDPWTLVNNEGKSFSAGSQGFAYNKVHELLFSGDWKLPLLAQHGPQEPRDMVLVMEALVRGEGKTEGFHSRRIAVPKQSYFDSETAASLSNEQIKEIAEFEKVLRSALVLVALGGDWEAKPGKSRLRKLNGYAQPAIERFKKRADDLFFQALWKRVAAQETGTKAVKEKLDFLQALRDAAEDEFRAALPAIPCASALRLRAEARAERRLQGGLWKQFPYLFEKEGAHAQQELDVA